MKNLRQAFWYRVLVYRLQPHTPRGVDGQERRVQQLPFAFDHVFFLFTLTQEDQIKMSGLQDCKNVCVYVCVWRGCWLVGLGVVGFS